MVDAIDYSAVMVLIFSSNANESRQIRREAEHAVSKGVTIVPVRIDQAEPMRSLAYFMAGALTRRSKTISKGWQYPSRRF
jgi:hypothetical protein